MTQIYYEKKTKRVLKKKYRIGNKKEWLYFVVTMNLGCEKMGSINNDTS